MGPAARVFALTLAVVCFAQPLGAQRPTATPVADVLVVIDDYRAGNHARGIAALRAMPLDLLASAVQEISEKDLINKRFDRMESTAVALLDSLTVTDRADPRFTRMWRLVCDVAVLLLDKGDRSSALHAWFLAADAFGEAARDAIALPKLMDNARGAFKDDVALLFATGSMYETLGYADTGGPASRGIDVASRTPTRNASSGFGVGIVPWTDDNDRTSGLKQARDFYQQVLKLAPSHVEARVRLARVLHLLNELPAALLVLEALPAQGMPENLLYLSRLFRAGIEEDLGHADKAQAAYLSALEWRAQAPFIGLSALLRAGGNESSSAGITRRLFLNPPDADPWWSYLSGQGAHLNSRLAEARAVLR